MRNVSDEITVLPFVSAVLQTDPSWLPARRGKFTASRAADAFKRTKAGWSESREKLKREIVAERAADWAVDRIVTAPMQRGLDYEPEARTAYEARKGVLVAPAALIDHPLIDNFAATPDGFLAPDGLLEIKVPLPTTYIDYRLAGVVPEQYRYQMLCQLACTGRKWVDFVAYCPELELLGTELFIRRFEPKPGDIQEVEEMAEQFLAEVDAMFEAFVNAPIEA